MRIRIFSNKLPFPYCLREEPAPLQRGAGGWVKESKTGVWVLKIKVSLGYLFFVN